METYGQFHSDFLERMHKMLGIPMNKCRLPRKEKKRLKKEYKRHYKYIKMRITDQTSAFKEQWGDEVFERFKSQSGITQ